MKTCDGWHPFLCRARAEWRVYKNGDYIADICGGHLPDAKAFGGFKFKKIICRAEKKQ